MNRSIGKFVAYVILAIAGIFAVISLVLYFDLQVKEYFLPKQMEVERETWEESQSFHKGTLQDLRKHRRTYLQLKKEYASLPEQSEKRQLVRRQINAIAASVRQRSSDLDKKDLKDHPTIRKFVEKMRNR